MAFVLVAMFVFFGLAALFFITVNLSGTRQAVQDLERDSARELAYQLANTPEFKWTDNSCNNCVDALKVLLVKQERAIYLPLWNLDYLSIELIYPNKEGECTLANFPNCKTITLANNSAYYGVPANAYISLCRNEKIETGGSFEKCEIAVIKASFE